MTAQNQHIQNIDILTEYNDLLTVADLSKIFRTSKQTVYKEMKNGKFGEPIQIGRSFLIPKVVILSKFFVAS
jgi:predicted DNA-binding transcriptional regulator AlpA